MVRCAVSADNAPTSTRTPIWKMLLNFRHVPELETTHPPSAICCGISPQFRSGVLEGVAAPKISLPHGRLRHHGFAGVTLTSAPVVFAPHSARLYLRKGNECRKFEALDHPVTPQEVVVGSPKVPTRRPHREIRRPRIHVTAAC